MEETFDKVRQIIALLFNVDETTLTMSSSPKTVPEWDSMGQLSLIIELEQQFDLAISPEASEKFADIAAVVEFIHESK
jgi:acyl carrier protein